MISFSRLNGILLYNRNRLKYINGRYMSILKKMVRDESLLEDKDDDRLTEVVDDRPMSNEPFGKNVVLGRVSNSLFVFPEIESNLKLDQLLARVSTCEENLQSSDKDGLLDRLKKADLLGCIVPKTYGGEELSNMEYARLIESAGKSSFMSSSLFLHEVVIKAISTFGETALKEKYLKLLSGGNNLGAIALTDGNSPGVDFVSVSTQGHISDDDTFYILNGTKFHVYNADEANILLVAARVPDYLDDRGKLSHKLVLMVVEKSFSGIKISESYFSHGNHNISMCDITFENTPVPVGNVLGDIDKGYEIAINIMHSSRFAIGSSLSVLLKDLLHKVASFSNSNNQFDQRIKNFETTKEKIADIAINTYALESMSYVICGILDGYREPDITVETAILKVFASETCLESVIDSLQILGKHGYLKEGEYQQYFDDILFNTVLEDTNDNLRLFIALTCFKHAGIQMDDMLRKLSDPFNNMSTTLLSMKRKWKFGSKKNRGGLNLLDQVHPSIMSGVERFQILVSDLELLVEHYISLLRKDIVNEHITLSSFADIIIDLFAALCCLARCSRSLAIGLQNCDHEAILTLQLCQKVFERVDSNLHKLEATRYNNGDVEKIKIADLILKNSGWVAQHPLTRNF